MTPEENLNKDDLLAAALAEAEKLEGEEHSDLLELISTEYCRRGDLSLAVELADTIQDPYLRERTIGTLASLSFDVQNPDSANELLDSIEDPSLMAVAIEQTAIQLAERGEFEEAVRLTDQLADPADALSNIAVQYARSGAFDDALEVAQMIEPPSSRTTTFGRLAFESLDKGRTDEALELLGEASESVEAIEFPEDQVYALVGIASAYEKAGDKESCVTRLNQALKLAVEIEGAAGVGISSTAGRDQALAQIVGTLTSFKSFANADKVVEQIEDPFQFAIASGLLAVGFHEDGQQGQAKGLLDQAVEVAREPELTGERGVALREQVLSMLAYRYALCGYYDESLKIAESMTGVSQKAELLTDIGRVSVGAGRDVVRVAELLNDPMQTSAFWLAISDAYWTANKQEEAEKSIAKAESSADAIENPYEKSLALKEIASLLHSRELPERARRVFTKAKAATDTVEVGFQKARCLFALSQIEKSVSQSTAETDRSAYIDPETVWISSNPIIE